MSLVKIGIGFAVSTEEEVGDTALEVGDGEMRIERGSVSIGANGLFVSAEGRVDEADVEENFARVGDRVEGAVLKCQDACRRGGRGEVPQRLVKVLSFVGFQSRDPCFDFSLYESVRAATEPEE